VPEQKSVLQKDLVIGTVCDLAFESGSLPFGTAVARGSYIKTLSRRMQNRRLLAVSYCWTSGRCGTIITENKQAMVNVAVYFASMLLTANFSSPTAALDHTTSQHVCQLSVEEQKFIDLINIERANRGMSPLSVNPVLVRAARDHSQEMWAKNYFDHKSPTPGQRTPMDRFLRALGRTPTWAYLGENLFYCSITDVSRGHAAFMRSPDHRANILNARFKEVGVGVYIAPDGQFFVTELFLCEID
jgi:uncharacterized protein YkwD